MTIPQSQEALAFVQRKKLILLPPTSLGNKFEVAAIRPPRALLQDIVPIFPALRKHFLKHKRDSIVVEANETNNADIEEPNARKLIIVPTVQQARVDLVSIGQEVEDEKNRLLESFMHWGHTIASRLTAQGYWVDFIDPMTAMPSLGPSGASGYSEVEGFEVLLNYRVQNVGCCKVILHPRWLSRIYPATLFTTAPQEALFAAMCYSVIAQASPVQVLNPIANHKISCPVFVSGVLRELKFQSQSYAAFSNNGETNDNNNDCISEVPQPISMKKREKKKKLAQCHIPKVLPNKAVVDLNWIMANGKRATAFVSLDCLMGKRVEAKLLR